MILKACGPNSAGPGVHSNSDGTSASLDGVGGSICGSNPSSRAKISINFVVDISGSMTDEIQTLKIRMASFVELFESDNRIDTLYSLVTFVDSARYKSNMISARDMVSLIARVQAEGKNKDFPEAGMGAVLKAAEGSPKDRRNFIF